MTPLTDSRIQDQVRAFVKDPSQQGARHMLHERLGETAKNHDIVEGLLQRPTDIDIEDLWIALAIPKNAIGDDPQNPREKYSNEAWYIEPQGIIGPGLVIFDRHPQLPPGHRVWSWATD